MSSTPTPPPPAQPVPSVPYGPAASAPVDSSPDVTPTRVARAVGSTAGKFVIRTLVVLIIRAIFRALSRR